MKNRLRATLALLALAGLVAAGLLLPVREGLDALLAWSATLGSLAPWVLGAAYIPVAIFMLPGSVLTLGSGFVLGLPLGFVAVTLGSNLAATVAFVLGRTVARPFVERRVAKNPRFLAVQEAVGENGFKIVFLLRLSPLFPFNLLNYALGITRVRLRDYVLATFLGMVPGTLMYVYLGSAAKSLAEVAAGATGGGWATRALFGLGLLATVGVTVVVTRIARRALSEAVEGDGLGSTPGATPEAGSDHSGSGEKIA